MKEVDELRKQIRLVFAVVVEAMMAMALMASCPPIFSLPGNAETVAFLRFRYTRAKVTLKDGNTTVSVFLLERHLALFP